MISFTLQNYKKIKCFVLLFLFFPLNLQDVYRVHRKLFHPFYRNNCIVQTMAKKKSANNSNTQSLLQVLNVKNVFDNEKFVFFSGIVLLAIAVFFIMSFISFFSTCEADQSLILSPQKDDLLNTQREFLNSCGSIGAYVSYFCIKQCFGIPAFIIPAAE